MATAGPRFDPSTLPSSTRERFAFLYTTACLIAIWCGSNFLFGLVNLHIPDENRGRLVAGLITMAATLLITVGLYLIHPLSRIRAFGASRALEYTNPAVDRITEISQTLGIPTPRVFIDDNIRNVDALSFGIPRRRKLLLGRGMLLLLSKRPSEFALRIAHELAHIKNGDVDLGYLARAMTQTTRVVLLIAYISYFGEWTWQRWANSSAFGDSFDTFIRRYIPAAAWQLSYSAAIFFCCALVIVIEYRSFLRSREHYADVAATSVASIADLSVAVGKERQWSFFGLGRLYVAHPSAAERVRVAMHPELLIQPGLAYFLYLGFVCGIVRDLVNFIWTILSLAFPSIDTSTIYQTHGTYFAMMRDPSVLELFFMQTWFFLLLLLPFVAAFGSLGVRTCLGKILIQKSFTQASYTLGLQSVIFFSSFALSAVAASHFVAQEPAIWPGLDSRPWTETSSIVEEGALYSMGYFVTSVLFIPGLRPSLLGKRSVRPNLTWTIFIISLWLYVDLMVVQMALVAFTVTIDPTPILANHVEAGVMVVFLLFIIGACWAFLKGGSSLIARRHLIPATNYTGQFAPWLYMQPDRAS